MQRIGLGRPSVQLPAPQATFVSGCVVTGRGAAAFEWSELRETLRAVTGGQCVAGSLNVILDRPLRLHDKSAAWIDRDGRSFWEASIGQVPVWLNRCGLPTS